MAGYADYMYGGGYDPNTDPAIAEAKRQALTAQLKGPGPSAINVAEPAAPAAPSTGPLAPSPVKALAPSSPQNTGIVQPGSQGPIASMPGPQANQTAPTAPRGDQAFLDWAGQTYGISKSRGGGFSDLPSGTSLEQVIQRYNQETGANAKYLGGPSGDRADFGEGVSDALTAGGQLWSDYGGRNGGGGGGDAGGGGMARTDGFMVNGTSGAGGEIDPAFRAALLKLMGESQKDVSLGDPALKGQSDAYRVARERAAQQERGTLAERAAFTGLNAGGQGSGAFDQGIGGIQEQSGQDIGSHDAGLVGAEVQNRRNALMQALQIANAVGARTEATQLQLQLAQMDAQYKDRALGQQQGQFEDSTGLDWARLQAQLNRDALDRAMMG